MANAKRIGSDNDARRRAALNASNACGSWSASRKLEAAAGAWARGNAKRALELEAAALAEELAHAERSA